MGIYVRSMKEGLVHGVCSIYCPLSVLAGCRLTLSSDPTLWMIMPTTRTGAKSATEQHLTSEHGMKDVWWTFSNGYKINGSGIYTVCLSFTERLLVIFSWFILANARINFLFPYFYISFVVFPDLEMKLTAPCRHKDQSKVLTCSKGNPAIQLSYNTIGRFLIM